MRAQAEQASRSAVWFAGTGWSKMLGCAFTLHSRVLRLETDDIVLADPVMYGILSVDMQMAKWKALCQYR
jgi:hypothetical protein